MNNFSAQDWVIILGALGILINNAISNWRMSAKVDNINATAKTIEGHVNSATTKNDERLKAGEEREKRLEATINELRKTAELLAQAKAIRDANTKVVVETPVRPSRATDSVQNEIRTDTVDTEVTSDIKTLASKLEIKPKVSDKEKK